MGAPVTSEEFAYAIVTTGMRGSQHVVVLLDESGVDAVLRLSRDESRAVAIRILELGSELPDPIWEAAKAEAIRLGHIAPDPRPLKRLRAVDEAFLAVD